MSSDARAGDDGRCSCSGALCELQLVEVVVELGKRLSREGIGQGTGCRGRFGTARPPLTMTIILAFANLAASVFRGHLLCIALCVSRLHPTLFASKCVVKD